MASKSLNKPIIRHIVARGYAQAAPAVQRDVKLQANVTANGTFTAALDNGSPVTRVTVAFRAGSRYEPVNEPGLAHVLRTAAGLTTGKASIFITARKLAQCGASVTASGDREFIYYTLESSQENALPALQQLTDLISCQEFRPWELSDNAPRLKYDIATLPPQVRAVDLLHKAAFRRGVGNSLFISPRRVGKVSSETLQHYAANYLTPNRCAIVVVGDNLDKANLVAQTLSLPSASSESAKEVPTTYYGGELRKDMGGDLAHVAIALQGAKAGTPQSLALAVASKALGNGPVTKWGADNTVLGKAIGNVGPFAAAGFNVSYTDGGLYGVVLSVPKDEAQKAVKAAASVLKNSSLSSEAIKAGKALLKLQVLDEAENGTVLAESLAAQGLTGTAKTPSDIANTIDSLSDSDISQALASATKSKISIGSAGNLAFVPYADEL